MNKKTLIAVGVIVVAFFGVMAGLLMAKKSAPGLDSVGSSTEDGSRYELGAITEMAERIDYSDLDLNSIIPPQASNGNFAENVEGDAKAPVVIYEYADYQCSSCAYANPEINKLLEEYDGKVALVFRTYVLPYHNNGVMAAAAANAAALQGYWREYKDLLFANQNDWFYASGSGLQEQLEGYFTKVSGGKGDLEKFRTDMSSEQVAQKIAFDFGAGKKMDLGGTPWFYIDGEWIENGHIVSNLRKKVDEKLAEMEKK